MHFAYYGNAAITAVVAFMLTVPDCLVLGEFKQINE
jgi:hypothetical protein